MKPNHFGWAGFLAASGFESPGGIYVEDLHELLIAAGDQHLLRDFVMWLLDQDISEEVREMLLDGDFDGDGLTLRQELERGTDPFRADPPQVRPAATNRHLSKSGGFDLEL